jgi:hypothetical protein
MCQPRNLFCRHLHDESDLAKLAGQYTSADEGSITLCFQPGFTATEACSDADAVPVVFNDPLVGSFTEDKAGNICGTSTDVLSAPGDVHPPIVTVQNVSAKVTNYDPSTASGDARFTDYNGGKCNGANFDSTGATVNNNGTLHFVASAGGDRRDYVATSLIDSVGDIGRIQFFGL